MSVHFLRCLCAALLLLSASLGQAQPQTKPNPLDAKASVPAVQYQGSLARYQRYADQPLASWRQANETVKQIGGWRTYAREAAEAQPAPNPEPPPNAPAKVVPASPAGHKH
jgi:hypothetical protein